MGFKRSTSINKLLLFIAFLLSIAVISCSPTKYIKDGSYLLSKNNLKIRSDNGIIKKGELRDNVEKLIIQKPNKYVLGIFPYKVWLYNIRYKKYERDSSNFQLKSKTVEKPVIFDSTLVTKSTNNIRNYLFNQGYFYPKVEDTFYYKKDKAFVSYKVNTGINYLIRKTTLDIDDSTINSIVKASMDETLLKEGQPFSMNLLQQERSRITNVLRDKGYYKFTQENIVDFSLDTFNKDLIKYIDNPFESAINFLALQKMQKKPTLDINIVIRDEVKDAYKQYKINNVTIYPDFQGRQDARDSTMKERTINGVKFRYHNYFVKENVLLKHVFLEKGHLYSQTDYDETINKLNQLSVFQTIRIFLVDDTVSKKDNPNDNLLNAYIILSPSKKYDFTLNFEVSTGTTYLLGVMPTVSFRDHNLFKGANLLTTSVSGGLESTYNKDVGNTFLKHFSLLTKTFSVNASINFPKFISPIPFNFSRNNQPRTILSFGTSLLDRVNYFTLTNTSSSFAYNWKQSASKTWDLTPAFINIIRLPSQSDSFKTTLDSNEFLRNSYRQTFIEGENIAFTFSNQIEKKGKSYTYLRLALEEAGGLMSGIDKLNLINNVAFSQYAKFDFDLRRYINRRRSQIATRFYGGVGVPLGQSQTLPYVKQYFVGGAYSIRGWRIRTLGPGGYYNPNDQNASSYIDRTGDLKLEMNTEYRFDMIQLFSGGIKVKGAVFADAGNIWLVKPSSDYPYGDFSFNRLGNDIAISAGAGARLDLGGFFVLRFDGAFPVKTPLNPTYHYGGWNDIFNNHFGLSDIVLNIAVGYPF